MAFTFGRRAAHDLSFHASSSSTLPSAALLLFANDGLIFFTRPFQRMSAETLPREHWVTQHGNKGKHYECRR